MFVCQPGILENAGVFQCFMLCKSNLRVNVSALLVFVHLFLATIFCMKAVFNCCNCSLCSGILCVLFLLCCIYSFLTLWHMMKFEKKAKEQIGLVFLF